MVTGVYQRPQKSDTAAPAGCVTTVMAMSCGMNIVAQQVYFCVFAVCIDNIIEIVTVYKYVSKYESLLCVDNIRYATEVDVDFVRKSVRAIGRCAIKVEQAAERCVSTLLDLIQTKVNYVVQEAVIVIKVCFLSGTSLYF